MEKQLWAEDAEQVRKEMELVLKEKVELYCIRRSAKNMKKLVVKGIGNLAGEPVLILDHPHEPTCGFPTCIFYYHRKNHPLRCFESVRVKRVEKFIGLAFPTQIYDIQRRLHPRVRTPEKCLATFSLEHKQRVYYGKVLNVSLAGARLSGEIPTIVKKGSVITPLVLTLYQQINTQNETCIHVPEASVMRAVYDEGEEVTIEMGVHFFLPPNELDALSDYIELRNIEESIQSKKGN